VGGGGARERMTPKSYAWNILGETSWGLCRRGENKGSGGRLCPGDSREIGENSGTGRISRRIREPANWRKERKRLKEYLHLGSLKSVKSAQGNDGREVCKRKKCNH